MPRSRRDGLAFTIIVTLVVGLCALPMALIIALSGAPSTMALAAALAAVPVGPVVGAYMWLDRYEPEPRSLLAMAVAWGAFAATLGALFVQGIGGFGVGFDEATQITWMAPLSEEATKGLFLLLLLWWRRNELDGLLDGIVYAGMIGVGFAFTENILYLAAAYNGTDGLGPGGIEALTGTFLLRCLASPFAHPLFTTFIGLGVGLAVTTRVALIRWLAPIAGYVGAVAAHALWNGSAVTGHFIGVYLTMMVPIFLTVAGFAFWQRRAERRMLTAALQDAAARGLIPLTDLPWIVDLRARKAARRYAEQIGGKSAAAATAEYQQAAVELGFLHHRYLRGTAPRDFAVRGHAFLARMQAVRPSVAFPGQVVPTR